MASLDYSPQQRAFIDFLFAPANKSVSLVVEATAGSGKTTALLEATYRSGDPTTLLCAFNRRIADELIERLSHRPLPRGRMIKAMTLHGIGLAIVKSHEQVKLDRDATDNLVREVVPSATFPAKRGIVKTVRHLKETCTPWDNPMALTNLVSELGVTEDSALIPMIVTGTQEVMAASRQYRPTLDFCDMIWRPYALDLAPKGRYKTVVVDEAQDLSLGQFRLIERLVAPGGRLVLVGDLRQEIYEWRGAVGAKIWAEMRTKGAKFLPLTWSFRCSRAVIAEARQIVPVIEPRPTAPAGVVDSMSLSEAIPAMRIDDFFLSRTNAGAVVSAIRTHLQGTPVRVLGGYDELDPLVQLIDKLDTSSTAKFQADLLAWKTKELDKDNLSDAQADRIEDRFDLLQEASGLVDPRQLIRVLRGIFRPSDAPAVIFSTVHKAKGLEAPRVFLLRGTFERHKLKRDGTKKTLAEVDLEEQNIEYVAITRAIDHLTWVTEPRADLIMSYGGEHSEDVIPVDLLDATDLGARIQQTIVDYAYEFGHMPDPEDPACQEQIKAMVDLGIPLPESWSNEP